MRQLRSLALLLVPAVLLLPACGSGSSSDGPGMASLTGEVIEVDGRADTLAGVSLALLETDAVATTNADGLFDFGAVPTGTLTLSLLPSALPSAEATSREGLPGGGGGGGGGSGPGPGGPREGEGPEHREGNDGEHEGEGHGYGQGEVDDGENASGQEMRVHRAREQERIHLRLRIRDGEIQEMHCVRETHRECEVEVVMSATADLDDDDLEGKLELESRDDRQRVKVYVAGADPDRVLEVVVIAPGGDEESLGTRTVDANGEAAWIVDASAGDLLPFLVGEVGDLEGYGVEVRDGDTGTALLEATIPAMPPFFGEGPGHRGQHGFGSE